MKQSAEKHKVVKLSLNDTEIEFCLTKEGRKIYEDYRKKYRHAPLKKVQGRWVCVVLWEFMYIFGLRMFMGANAVVVGNVIRIKKI